MTLDVLQDRIGYRFKDESLLVLAVTHSSWANEHGLGQAHNERLEFLGDAVLELCISWELFTRFPQAREGDMTRVRSQLVGTTRCPGRRVDASAFQPRQRGHAGGHCAQAAS